MTAVVHVLEGAREEYYSKRIVKSSATPQGVDWSSQESQQRRFLQLAKTIGEYGKEPISLIACCRYGSLCRYLKKLDIPLS